MSKGEFKVSGNLNGEIISVLNRAYLGFLTRPKEGRFVNRLRRLYKKSFIKRTELSEKEGLVPPPFLVCNFPDFISSGGEAELSRQEEKWMNFFEEAVAMGINYTFVIGNDPLRQEGLLQTLSKVKDMLFFLFTDGSSLNSSYIKFLDRYRNLLPVIMFDERNETSSAAISLLEKSRVFFGVCYNVKSDNIDRLSVEEIRKSTDESIDGCRLIFIVNFDADLDSSHIKEIEKVAEEVREVCPHAFVFNFPVESKDDFVTFGSGKEYLFIGKDGKIYPDIHSADAIGEASSDGLKTALKALS